MTAKITRIIVLLLIASTQFSTIFTAKEEPQPRKFNRPESHKRKKPHHGSKFHKSKKPCQKPPFQKPDNPLGPGVHTCESGHRNFGNGCPRQEKKCPQDPESPDYKYKK